MWQKLVLCMDIFSVVSRKGDTQTLQPRNLVRRTKSGEIRHQQPCSYKRTSASCRKKEDCTRIENYYARHNLGILALYEELSRPFEEGGGSLIKFALKIRIPEGYTIGEGQGRYLDA